MGDTKDSHLPSIIPLLFLTIHMIDQLLTLHKSLFIGRKPPRA